jgi:hypothetical protein
MSRHRATPLEVQGASSAVWCAFGLCVAAVLASCSSKHVDLAMDPLGRSDGGRRDAAIPVLDSGVIDASIRDSSVSPPSDAMISMPRDGAVARCGTKPCACDDGLDNDGDDLIDGQDPECTGALDQDERTFSTGTGTKAKSCRDCFWDENQGAGDDSCRYPSECLRGEAPNGNGNCSSCQVSQNCVDVCKMRTPSGCDCFGCCEVRRPDGVIVPIELTETCSLDKIDNPTACPRCTQSTQCRNTCGRCELCPGRTLADLPADCLGRTPPNECEEGQPVCVTSADCTIDQYCQLGCCFGLLL